MGHEPLSQGAQDFISTYIRSVRQLELLLFVRERQEERWSAARVASALRVTPRWAEVELDAMRASGLLDSDGEAYRYAPAGEEDRVIAELDDCYRRRKPTVIQAVLNSLGSDVQALSDAFRLRPPRDG